MRDCSLFFRDPADVKLMVVPSLSTLPVLALHAAHHPVAMEAEIVMVVVIAAHHVAATPALVHAPLVDTRLCVELSLPTCTSLKAMCLSVLCDPRADGVDVVLHVLRRVAAQLLSLLMMMIVSRCADKPRQSLMRTSPEPLPTPLA